MSKKTFATIILIVVALAAGAGVYLVLNRPTVDNTVYEPEPLAGERLEAAAELLKSKTAQSAAQVKAQEKAAENLKATSTPGGMSEKEQKALESAAEALKAK